MAQLPVPDHRLRRARLFGLASLATGVITSLLLPGRALLTASPFAWAGLLAFAVTHALTLHAAMTPWLPEPARRRRLWWLFAASAASVPLIGVLADPVAWVWIAVSLIGVAPLIGHRGAAVATVAGSLATITVLGLWSGAATVAVVAIAVIFGAVVASVNWLQVWYWDLLLDARQGKGALASLAVTEQRLQFAREIHDVLGHKLSVIALKAELAARLAPTDPARAGAEAAEVQRLAATALDEMHEAVRGYRTVDLSAELTDVARVLESCGVRCTVTAAGTVPPDLAGPFAAVLREATTNVLRHSRASWCTIDVTMTTMTITNDGVRDRSTRGGFGLRGLAERLAPVGGIVRHRRDGDRFVVEVTVEP